MNPLSEAIDALGFTSPWTYLALFLATSLVLIWRLEALLEHGLEGTALGTLVMPYCSGLGNLIFVGVILARRGPVDDVVTNCLVNNVTNLTLLLGLPAVLWGLQLQAPKKAAKPAAGKKRDAEAKVKHELNRLSLLLTLTAVIFFSGITWALGLDGRLDSNDGLVLVALFVFWQCFHVFDVMKHNVRQRRAFSPLFYLDLFFVALAAYGLYVSIDWLVTWLTAQDGAFINAKNMGWLSGWLMVVPNALLAFYYTARRRADVAFASQVGDGHICIPLALGLCAAIQPLKLPAFFETGLAILIGAAVVHALCVMFASGLPRWMGWPFLVAYAWFVAAGFPAS